MRVHSFDFGKKKISFAEPFDPTDDLDKDFKKIGAFYKGVKGKIPEYSFEVE